jgi:hypothetical protein
VPIHFLKCKCSYTFGTFGVQNGQNGVGIAQIGRNEVRWGGPKQIVHLEKQTSQFLDEAAIVHLRPPLAKYQ